MNRTEIQALLPHEPPFIFLDEVESLQPGEEGCGIYVVPHDAFWTDAHFPTDPIFPGVLLIEALAQVAAVVYLSAQADPHAHPIWLAGVDRVRFRSPVRPGDRLLMSVAATRKRTGFWIFEGTISRGDEAVGEAKLMAAMGGKNQATTPQSTQEAK